MAPRITRSVLAIAGGVGACGYPFPDTYETDRAVRSEHLDHAYVEVELPSLAEHELELIVAIGPAHVRTGALESLLLSARRRGVPVRAWLVLDEADGYWANESNLAALRDHVDAFWSWNRRGKLGVTRIVVEMAPPLAQRDEIAAAVAEGRIADAIPTLMANRDPEAFAGARADWASAVDDWHAQGIVVDVVALPWALDDFADDDADLQDMLESPIDGIDWDEVGFRVHQDLFGGLGPDLVRSYGASAVQRFGERTSVGLGGIGSAYPDVGALRVDVQAVAAAGAGRFALDSLDGMKAAGGVDVWSTDLELVPAEVAASPAVQAVRAELAAIDAM